MAFSVKQLPKSEFYDIFASWLNGHNFPLVRESVLPENAFVCYSGNIPVYCYWVYKTDSKLVWLGYSASNKEVPFSQREGGLGVLVTEIENHCKTLGIEMIITTTGTKSIMNPLIKSGFIVGDACVHLTKKL